MAKVVVSTTVSDITGVLGTDMPKEEASWCSGRDSDQEVAFGKQYDKVI